MALDKVKVGVLDGASTGVKSDRHTIPSVTTSERDAGSFSAAVGDTIYNSTIGNLQQYTATGWASVEVPPVITGVTYPTESGAVLTALDATGSSDAAQTLIINGTNFTSTVTVEILVGSTYSAFSSSTSVNGARTQITCTGVTKRAAADNYTLRVTNSTGLSASTTVNFSADPSFSTAANLGTVYAGQTLSKSIAFTGTKVIQGATAKPTWMTVTGNTSTADNGASDTTFDATGSPAVLGGTIAAPASGNTQNHTFSIIVRDAENQTFNRDFSLTAVDYPTGGTIIEPANYTGNYRSHTFLSGTTTFTLYAATTVDILIVAGGGAGSRGTHGGGGGGAGGMRVLTSHSMPVGTYSIVVGAGGTGVNSAVAGDDGDPSSITQTSGSGFSTLSATGGGGAGVYSGTNSVRNGRNGGSGGGGAEAYNTSGNNTNTTGGTGDGAVGTDGNTAGYYGGDGGSGQYGTNTRFGGAGGGGAGANGSNSSTSQHGGGAGGNGLQNNFRNGTNVYYAGGGAGNGDNAGAAGGNGGGGTSPGGGNAGDPGDANTGGGGSGGGDGGAAGSGGSGIVVIRYAA